MCNKKTAQSGHTLRGYVLGTCNIITSPARKKPVLTVGQFESLTAVASPQYY